MVSTDWSQIRQFLSHLLLMIRFPQILLDFPPFKDLSLCARTTISIRINKGFKTVILFQNLSFYRSIQTISSFLLRNPHTFFIEANTNKYFIFFPRFIIFLNRFRVSLTLIPFLVFTILTIIGLQCHKVNMCMFLDGYQFLQQIYVHFVILQSEKQARRPAKQFLFLL